MNKNKTLDKKVELLSPAGSFEAFTCAINNGADAIYLAGSRFGARAYAGNFSENELLVALDKAHLYGKRIYLTVNTVFKDREMEELYDFLIPYYENGLDGVIVQDIGVGRFIRTNFPKMELHASTQMSITDVYGVNLLKEMGFCRVVPAREISLEEIKNIIETTGVEVESFIHGAMCYSYSGKCLFSSFLGERSGNRGRCAQPCRLEFNDQYPLSMKDMYSLRILPKLIDAKIASFKIEGRMKSPEYVANVTRIYRKYIDYIYENPNEYCVDPKDERLILDAYTRSGNCNGYYEQYNGKSMITILSPAYNGEHKESTTLDFNSKISKKTVTGFGNFIHGEESYLTLNYDDKYITVYGEVPMEAINRPTDEESIKKQLNKTGADDFEFSELTLNVDNNIFIPVGKINELRRNAFEMLKMELLEPYKRSKPNEDVTFSAECKKLDVNKSSQKVKIAALSRDKHQIDLLLKYEYLDEVILPYSFVAANCDNADFLAKINKAKDKNIDIVIKLPFVLRRVDFALCEKMKSIIESLNVNTIIACNYEEINLLKDIGFEGEIVASEHLYCLNKESVVALRDLGISTTTVPLELTKGELKRRSIKGEDLYVYGKAPLMISAQCINNTLKGCDKIEKITYINDRKGVDFPVRNICDECTNVYYNSVPSFVEKDEDMIRNLNVNRLVLSFVDENDEFILKLLNYYCRNGSKPDFEYTRGHLNRSVE